MNTIATELTFEDILDEYLGGWSVSLEVDALLGRQFDLELVGESWSFNLLSFWVRKSDGQILYGSDAGCSCPTPYEDRRVRDLKEIKLDAIPDLIRRATEYSYGLPTAEVLRKYRERILPKLIALGAK